MERVFKLQPDKRDERDFRYKAVLSPQAAPLKANLKGKMPPVFDQGSLGSCTSNASVAFTMMMYFMSLGQMPPYLSRLDHYWHERDLEGTVNEDAGATLRDACKVMANRGIPFEEDWPYVPSKFRDKPPAVADDNAGKYRIKEYHRVNSLDELRLAIGIDGVPVIIGIQIFPSFMSNTVAATGYVPMPDRAKENSMGGHAILVVGYDDVSKLVIVRNSWGSGWGDQGYFYLPYEYIQDASLTFDMWTGTLESVPAPEPIKEMTVEEAINLFVSKGIFDSPDFWINLANKSKDHPHSDFRFVGLAFIKLAKYIESQ